MGPSSRIVRTAVPAALVSLSLAALVCSCQTRGAAGASPPPAIPTPGLTELRAPEIRYAAGLAIRPVGTGALVEVLHPWRDSNVSLEYLLVPRGATPPEGYPGAVVIETPVRTIVTMSTTQVAFVGALGAEERIVGASTTELVCNPAVRARIDAGEVRDVGEGATVNMELLLELDPDLVVTGASGSSATDCHEKINEAGIPALVCGSWMEETPLGRAEWIKLYGLLLGREDEAETLFAGIVERYEALAREARKAEPKPTVFANAGFEGTWWVPGGQSYMAAYFADAGASYVWSDDETAGGVPLSMEAVVARAAEAEYWLNPGPAASMEELRATDSRYELFRAFREGRVYSNDARTNEHGGNDYWETSVIEPDVVLADLVSIFHPELVPDHQPVYHRKLP